MTFKFTGKATGQDPTGYVYVSWDNAQDIVVLADTRDEATEKAYAMLGRHPRWASGRSSGWLIRWSNIEEQPVVDWRSQYPEFAAWLDNKEAPSAGSTA